MEKFSSKIGFIFASVASAVGLGVLWKFPYLVGMNGGGAFICAYVFCVLFMGMPLFMGELLLGRKTQKAAIGAFNVHIQDRSPLWGAGALIGILASFFILSFYTVVAGWGLSYLLMSLQTLFKDMNVDQASSMFHTLERSGDICILWHGIFTLITAVIVSSGIQKGIEHWSRAMTKGLFVILLLLFCYSLTLSGRNAAYQFLFSFNWDLFTLNSLLEAAGLAFFTLSVGQGIMFSYGSYMKSDQHIPTISLIVSLSVIVMGLLCACTIFPVVFTFGFEPTAGTGLIFQVLPYLFSKLTGGAFLSILFFILFFFTAVTSAIAFLESVVSNVMDKWQLPRKKAVAYVASISFLMGIPCALSSQLTTWTSMYGKNFLDSIDTLVSLWLMPLAGLITALFLGFVVHKDVCHNELKQSGAFKLFFVWRGCVRYLIPGALIVLLLQKTGVFAAIF